MEMERGPGGNVWAKQISGGRGVAWAWWAVWREKQFPVQVGALREMQIAASLHVAENRTKARIPRFRYFMLFKGREKNLLNRNQLN